MGRRKKHKFNKESAFGEYGDFLASICGFFVDGLKVIFKLKPDEDQTMHDFVFEKLGAVTLLIVCVGLVIGLVAAIFLQLASETHYGY